MKLQRLTAISALVVGAITAGTTAAQADPAAAPQPAAIKYSMKLVDKTVVTTLQGGAFRIAADGKSYAITHPRGVTVVSLPTEVRVAGTEVPVKPVVDNDGTALELTSQRTATVDEPVTVQVIASPMENHRAMNEFETNFGVATAVGTFLGTAVGAIVGGVTGCILGLPLLGVGCIPAAVAGAGIGGILGTIAVGGPALGIAGMDLINTLQAAPGTTKWAEDSAGN
ncbi:hypothetical protein C5E45_21300 [Nocardia nova]|uniref:DUF8020 domain-containing protein n=1 Tax=Nocardia nova TaxID=37330 RepID=A0A2S6ALZ4_9NOCA|nr:hypothetical protein [Nocardia nova]PPJ32613.1 hypothetical protein C5E41_05790 [Nocardia nova]PPJ36255.1 hypothetical protein C5E45_21300 [Nocardia nova]